MKYYKNLNSSFSLSHVAEARCPTVGLLSRLILLFLSREFTLLLFNLINRKMDFCKACMSLAGLGISSLCTDPI